MGKKSEWPDDKDIIEICLARSRKARGPIKVGNTTKVYLTVNQRDTLVIMGQAFDRADNLSYKEIAKALNKPNASQSWFLVNALKGLGIVEDDPTKHRSIRLSEFGRKLWRVLRPRYREE